MKAKQYSILSMSIIVIALLVTMGCGDKVSWELSPECEGTDDTKGCVTITATWDNWADSIAEKAPGDLIGTLTLSLVDTTTLEATYTFDVTDADLSSSSSTVEHVFKNVVPGPYYVEALLDDDDGGGKDFGDLYYFSLSDELFESSQTQEIVDGSHHSIYAEVDLVD